MADIAKAAESKECKGLFNTFTEWQQKGCDKAGKHFVLVDKLGLTNLRIRTDVSGDKKADSNWMRVAKLITTLVAALPVFVLFGVATLFYKGCCMIKDGGTNVWNWISGTKTEKKKEEETTSTETKTTVKTEEVNKASSTQTPATGAEPTPAPKPA